MSSITKAQMRVFICLAGVIACAQLATAGSASCDALDAKFPGSIVNRTSTYDDGYTVEYYDSGEKKDCSQSFILIPGFNLWPKWIRIVTLTVALTYLFLGISIISDIFMAAVEVITAKEKEITLESGEVLNVQYWNPTVANLTLMALGSSAPEILLAVIETMTTLGDTPGELGPSTIVGSAAFNLLAISAVCIMAIPDGEFRIISDVGVFITTATWSIWAYVWMLIVLEMWTPGVVSIAEAVLTFAFFPLFVAHSYMQDKNWFLKGSEDGTDEEAGEDFDDMKLISIEPVHVHGSHHYATTQSEKRELVRSLRSKTKAKLKLTQDKIQGLGKSLMSGLKKKKKSMSSNFWKINARRALGGRRHYKTTAVEKSPYETDHIPDSNGMAGSFTSDHVKDCRVNFTAREYRVLENAGHVSLLVRRVGGQTRVAQVDYDTMDGTAVAGKDYEPQTGTLVFQPGETTKEIKIPIIDDDEPEPDQTFCVQLHNPSGSSGAGGEVHLGGHSVAQVVIIDDDDPGVLGFEKSSYEVSESAGSAVITVCRYGGAAGEVSVEYYTTDGSAVAGEDYVATEGVLTFKSGEVNKDITIEIIDDDIPEPDTVFHVFLRKPTGQAQLHKQNIALVKVVDDDGVDELADVVEKRLKVKDLFMLRTATWRQQLLEAMEIGSGVDENGEEDELGNADYILHFLTFGWKVIFALLPPTDYFGGWATFFTSLIVIGVITAVVRRAANKRDFAPTYLGTSPPHTLGTSPPHISGLRPHIF
mmetsp:Transcript_12800/g.40453  ORF Transcript_12800/g.40453 Transcript_12800/m.40453 type:complete len:759 (+) Transcript_12800:158-2434(+)